MDKYQKLNELNNFEKTILSSVILSYRFNLSINWKNYL